MKRCLVLFLLAGAAGAEPAASFSVRESYGLRRFGYPMRAAPPLKDDPSTLRLLENGKPVPAQFTRAGAGRVEVDFNVSLGPGEVRRYTVERGAGAKPASATGIRVEETPGAFLVRYPQGLEFEVPKDLRGLLAAVREAGGAYVRNGSRGLLLNGQPVAAMKGAIVKNGPLVALLRFESPGGQVELEFPRSKSWVEVRWRMSDPKGAVTALGAEVNLDLAGDPTLADFGAGSMVYAALRKGQNSAFVAELPAPGRPAWRIEVGNQPYASGSGFPLDGWVHVMDLRRATALAVDAFARGPKGGSERIETGASGELRLERTFVPSQPRTLRFWLHFVKMPVQAGAATSPQSIQNPPRVEWR